MEIYQKTLEYLKLKIPECQIHGSGKGMKFTCPICRVLNVNSIPNTHRFFCHGTCNKIIGTIIDFVRILEEDKRNWTEIQIKKYLGELFEINITKDKVTLMLELYQKHNFDLVPISPDSKIPIEREWPTKLHKNIDEWKSWLTNKLNIGVKTGKRSNITIIDLDTKDIPKEIEKFVKDYKGMLQETKKGFHYFYQYEPELTKTRIDEFKLDIENDGGQVLLFPSIVEGNARKLIVTGEIPKIGDDFKLFLKKYIKVKPKIEEPEYKEIDLTTIGDIKEGNRNNFLFTFGSMLRKELNSTQTGYALNLVNRYCCKPSLNFRELATIVQSVEKYINSDLKELASKILTYLNVVGEATARDIKEVTGEKKEPVDKTLAYLVKEDYILKRRSGATAIFQAIKKANWKDIFPDLTFEVPFQVPYFYDKAIFNWGDMLLLGSKSKWGKTTISINIVRKLVDQGYKPYYICLETGSRFIKTAMTLQLRDGDFFWDFQADPTKIELEKNAITIIDWLLIEDKAQTDVVLKHFCEQLFKTNGFLIIFMQLKKDGTWFAPNMVEQFPSLGARYLYKDESDGTEGTWHIDCMREAKMKSKTHKVDCIYDWDKKTLKRIDE